MNKLLSFDEKLWNDYYNIVNTKIKEILPEIRTIIKESISNNFDSLSDKRISDLFDIVISDLIKSGLCKKNSKLKGYPSLKIKSDNIYVKYLPINVDLYNCNLKNYYESLSISLFFEIQSTAGPSGVSVDSDLSDYIYRFDKELRKKVYKCEYKLNDNQKQQRKDFNIKNQIMHGYNCPPEYIDDLKRLGKVVKAPKNPNKEFLALEFNQNDYSKIKLFDANNGSLVGYIGVRGNGFIDGLRVSNMYQGLGLGNWLFEYALNHGAYKLDCAGVRAIELYHKYGFLAIGVSYDGNYDKINTEEKFKEFKDKFDNRLYKDFRVAHMYKKDHLNEVPITLELAKEVDKYISANYKGMEEEVPIKIKNKEILEEWNYNYYTLQNGLKVRLRKRD